MRATIALWLVLLAPLPVAGHAPLARSVAIATPAQVAVRMPGFGIVLGGIAEAPRYACDALLGLDANDHETALVARPDGSWLLGARSRALRIVSAGACTWRLTTGWPNDVGVAAAACVSDQPEVCFAVSEEASPRLYRSDDAGESWHAQTELGAGESITALRAITSTDDVHVYVTRPQATATAVLQSIDGGRTFASVVHGEALTLHDVRGGTPDTLWLSSPRPASGDVAILRSTAGAAVTEERHRVRFFGGLALDPSQDTVWVADEAGALARSIDDGATFEPIHAALAVACLTFVDGRLWACTTGTNQQPALAYSDDRGASFTGVFAFTDVDALVGCSADAGVADTCRAAWAEWRADVLPVLGTDAGAETDAGRASDASDTDPGAAVEGCGCHIVGKPRPLRHAVGATLGLVLTSLALTLRCARMRWRRRAPR